MDAALGAYRDALEVVDRAASINVLRRVDHRAICHAVLRVWADVTDPVAQDAWDVPEDAPVDAVAVAVEIAVAAEDRVEVDAHHVLAAALAARDAVDPVRHHALAAQAAEVVHPALAALETAHLVAEAVQAVRAHAIVAAQAAEAVLLHAIQAAQVHAVQVVKMNVLAVLLRLS